MIIRDLTTLKDFCRTAKAHVFGAGVYAFYRLGPEELFPRYRLLALRDSLDTRLIRKEVKILSLEKGMGTKHIREPRNATTVIKHAKTAKYLASFSDPAILVRKTTAKMEAVCTARGWKLLANSYKFGKELFEDKIKFRKILEELDICVPSGRITSVDKLHYGHLMNKYGLPFVIQHPTKGGGKGTFFVSDQETFTSAVKKLKATRDNSEWEEKAVTPPAKVIVSKFIDGPSPSLTGCVTRAGILSTNLQHQVLDVPELYNPDKGSGLFCGHDWSSAEFSEKTSEQAWETADKVGAYFKEMGYRGIFGLDFVMDKKTGRLYVTECNPRLLGSYPVLNMAQLLNQEPPILAFHILEFLDADYEMDVDDINRLMRQRKKGAQMILHNLTGRWARNHQQVKAGVYKLHKKKLKYLRPGYDLKHLENKEEFLLAEGVPFKRSHFSPNRRICRILTLTGVLDKTCKELTPWAKEVAETVYQAFQMKPVRFIRFKKIFFPNLLAKG